MPYLMAMTIHLHTGKIKNRRLSTRRNMRNEKYCYSHGFFLHRGKQSVKKKLARLSLVFRLLCPCRQLLLTLRSKETIMCRQELPFSILHACRVPRQYRHSFFYPVVVSALASGQTTKITVHFFEGGSSCVRYSFTQRCLS